MDFFRDWYMLLGAVALLNVQLVEIEAQTTSSELTVEQFTDLSVNGTKVWVILAVVGGIVVAIILGLLIAVCCAFAKRGSKVSPPGVENGGHYIVDPDRFPSVETQTDHHPGFSKIVAKMDQATMTKRSMWTGVRPATEPSEETVQDTGKPTDEGYVDVLL